MPRGGSLPGERRGGRQKGTPNKASAAFRQRLSQKTQIVAEVLGPVAFQGDAHALLMAVYKDTSLPFEVRLFAAAKAIPYERPRLAPVIPKTEPDPTGGECDFSKLSTEQLHQLHEIHRALEAN